jgi:hypothetical protein
MERSQQAGQIAHHPLLLAGITPSNVAGVLFSGGGFGHVLSACLAANSPDEHPHQHWGRAFNLTHHSRPDKMKFFGVLFIILGIIIFAGGLMTTGYAFQAAYIPNPTPIPMPGVPQLTGGQPIRSDIGESAALIYVVGATVLGLLMVAQGTLFYTVGDINEKIDDLLKANGR